MTQRPISPGLDNTLLTGRFQSPAQQNATQHKRVLGALSFLDDLASAQATTFPSCKICCPPWQGATAFELWQGNEPAVSKEVNGIQTAANGQWMFARLAIDDCNDQIAEKVRQGYGSLLVTLRELGYPFPFRIWNYLPNINHSDNQGLERYRAFCQGRARAFLEDANYSHGALPAGTCVGSFGGAIEIAVLAQNHADLVNIENPRQVPAYCYPSHYGPKPPSFARATFVPIEEGGMLFVSGTASVIGHASHHHGDVLAQCRATIENLESLFSETNLTQTGIQEGIRPEDMDQLKIYVRHTADMPAVAAFCKEAFPRSEQLIVQADICREELLVEIEGICRIQRTGGAR